MTWSGDPSPAPCAPVTTGPRCPHDRLGGTGRATGFWLEELAAPYCRFKEAAWEITLASPKGGQPPLDPKSNQPGARTDRTRRFEADTEVMTAPANTVRLVAVDADDYDILFHPACHGPLWDLAEDTDSARLIETTSRAGKPLAPVCHAPGVLRHARNEDGTPLVQGRKVTGATNTEEDGVQLTEVVPFPVEDELGKLGGHYTKQADWQSYVVLDGLLITGRNPASSGPAADAPWTTPYAPAPSARTTDGVGQIDAETPSRRLSSTDVKGVGGRRAITEGQGAPERRSSPGS